jgi:hypothetical protein
VPRQEGIDEPVNEGAIGRLSGIREFTRAFERGGMTADEFISYGVTQRTLSSRPPSR